MEKRDQTGMTLIVKTITRLTIGAILLFGFYITLRGHLGPGGGFAGGVIAALSLINLFLAFGRERALSKLSRKTAVFLVSAGAVLFILIALLGYLGGAFFRNFLNIEDHLGIVSGGTIPWSELAIALLVGTGLFVVFAVLVLFRVSGEEKNQP